MFLGSCTFCIFLFSFAAVMMTAAGRGYVPRLCGRCFVNIVLYSLIQIHKPRLLRRRIFIDVYHLVEIASNQTFIRAKSKPKDPHRPKFSTHDFNTIQISLSFAIRKKKWQTRAMKSFQQDGKNEQVARPVNKICIVEKKVFTFKTTICRPAQVCITI